MKAVIMFSGFQESEARQSGFERGFFTVVRPFANGDITVYHPRTWKTNVRNLLRQLYENGISEVAVICYSHGQAAAMAFAREAPQYGVTVELLLACDPVYRPTWAPRETWAQVFAIRAMLGKPKIKVPSSVREVHYVYQTLDSPNGDTMVAENTECTKVATPIKISLPHTRIDESPTWWSLVRMHLARFAGQAGVLLLACGLVSCNVTISPDGSKSVSVDGPTVIAAARVVASAK
jgi:hypothetical protein